MSQVHNFSFGTFAWWVGKVEDREDPDKLGRVRVRVFGYYDSDSIGKDDLPWAQVMQPVTSAARAGVGTSPVGLQVGSHVVGFFADGDNAQVPIVMGSLGAAPNGEPDTNRLTRGEELEQTVVATKRENILTSVANSMAGSALSKAAAIANDVNQQMDNAKGAITSMRTQFAGLQGLPAMAGLNRLSSIVTQIAIIPANAEALKAELEGEVRAIKGQVEYLKNLDPEELARYFVDQQVGDVEAAIKGLKSLNFDSAMSTLQSIPMAIGQVQRLQDALLKSADLSGIVSQVKSLSRAIPNLGSIRALGQTVATANTWLEPLSAAAPIYPFNKITQTEGGHIQEMDDTPGAERYHQYHPAGTFVEIQPDGTEVHKVVKDDYAITMGDKYIHVQGKVQVNIVGDATVVVNGNCTTQVSGDKVDVVSGNYSLAVGGDISITSGGSHSTSATAQYAVRAARVDLN